MELDQTPCHCLSGLIAHCLLTSAALQTTSCLFRDAAGLRHTFSLSPGRSLYPIAASRSLLWLSPTGAVGTGPLQTSQSTFCVTLQALSTLYPQLEVSLF